MTLLASALTGTIGFGVFVVASLVLIGFVIRFARGLGRNGPDGRGGPPA